MNTFRFFFIVLFFFASFLVHAQNSSSNKIVILPFTSNGIDEISLLTTESILRQEISKLSKREIVNDNQVKNAVSDSECYDLDCAVEAGKLLGADEVVAVKLSMLGEKIIVQYFLADVNLNKTIVMDQVTSTSIEDLEVVMKRVASSLITAETIDKNAEVGKIMESESQQSLRRASRKNIGVSFGYLYPQSGYGEDKERTFVFDLHLDYELPDYAVGLLLGVRHGFAMNIYGSYLFTKTDICPYVGGAFGFHWVSASRINHQYGYYGYGYTAEEKKSDGFEFTLSAGTRILHTYNFQILVNLDFIYTMNDYDDKAIVFTIGIL